MRPSVKLISIGDNREKAWRYSRPNIDHGDLDMEEIGKMDLPVNSLCMLTFEVTSSIIFRDWLLCIRPIFCWARSSRAMPLSLDNMSVSSEFSDNRYEDIAKIICDIDSGMEQDKARENIPLSMSVSYTVSMDMRTCVGMVKSMWLVDSMMAETYAIRFYDECRDIKGFMDSKVKEFTGTYMPTEGDRRVKGLRQIGSMVIGRYMMKEAFAAQFIRTSQARVKFDLWWEIKHKGYLSLGAETQADKFDMTFYIDSGAYHKMMKSRAHWLADWSDDMWGNMVNDYIDGMDNKTFWEFIEGEDDPYAADMKNRIECTDPGLPSPITLEMPSLIKERTGNSGILFQYQKLVDDGFIKDNHDNKMRIKYENIKSK